MSLPVRERFTREIRNVAVQASANAIDDIGSRLHILALALAPELGTVERAIRHFEGTSPFPTTEREQIASYVVSAIERRLLDGDSLIPLRHISENPLGWLDSFSRACVPSGITQVRRARMRDARAIGASLPEVGDALAFPSAEDRYIGHVEQMHAELALRMLEENPSMGEWERHSIAAHTFARSLGVPLPHIGSNRDRRWICEQLVRPEFAVELRRSLQAAHDLAAGSPECRKTVPAASSPGSRTSMGLTIGDGRPVEIVPFRVSRSLPCATMTNTSSGPAADTDALNAAASSEGPFCHRSSRLDAAATPSRSSRSRASSGASASKVATTSCCMG